jgi:hypothetical protein
LRPGIVANWGWNNSSSNGAVAIYRETSRILLGRALSRAAITITLVFVWLLYIVVSKLRIACKDLKAFVDNWKCENEATAK